MAKFHTLLSLRLKSKDSQKKNMNSLADRSHSGDLSSFSGVFRVTPLREEERETLESMLKSFRESDDYSIKEDLESLLTITSEVRAITNQAVMLHGERIKKAQRILKSYREGAFTAWLITTYGNRQTPYNFLQYYEFYMAMPSSLHPKIDEMPRQAVYTLASRSGEMQVKEKIVEEYYKEPKRFLLEQIRKKFPIPETDKRLPRVGVQVLQSLDKIKALLKKGGFTSAEEEKILSSLEELKEMLPGKILV